MKDKKIVDFIKMTDSNPIIRNVMDEMPLMDRQHWWNECLADYEKEEIMNNPSFDNIAFEKKQELKQWIKNHRKEEKLCLQRLKK